MNDILRQIDDQILDTEIKLEKLRHAREVVAALDNVPIKPKPLITVKRIAAKPVPSKLAPDGKLSKVLKARFLEEFKRDRTALDIGMLIERVFSYEPSVKERKGVWNALSQMVKAGQITRISTGFYRIKVQHEEASQGPEQLRVQVSH